MNQNNLNLAKLDLNLIIALYALLEKQSVTEAANCVGRTQSAMSHSLSRLRDHFEDPLLVRDGWAMRPTPLAELLRPKVYKVAALATDLFAKEEEFDPSISARSIKIAAPDLCVPLLTQLIAEIAINAPNIKVKFISVDSVKNAILRSEADIGLAFGAPQADPSLIAKKIANLNWCSFTPTNHPYAESLNAHDWERAAHIVVGQHSNRDGPIYAAAKANNIDRRIICAAPNFYAALSLASQSNALFTTMREPFEPIATKLGLVPRALPFDMPSAPVILYLRSDYGDGFQLWLQKLCAQFLINLSDSNQDVL